MSRRRLVVEADGGSRGNPGVAGFGALVLDASTGTLLAERAAPIGRASNNVAEYSGLIAGLQAADDIDPAADVEVRMDSKLVVEQMSGRWKIKHDDMRRLAGQARQLVAERDVLGGTVTFTWIPRELNKAADKLSNDGMDGRRVDRRHEPGGPTDPDTGERDDPPPEAPAASGPPDVGPPDVGPPARIVLV
ncbi:MAG: reverse transcriptase-like protein, partial [Dermatophilaceae bacterium]